MSGRRQAVQTIRQPSSSALLIDSLDRYPLGYPFSVAGLISSSSWTTQKQNYVLNGYFNRLSLTQIQLFWNLPTIITGYNDKLEVIVGSTTYTIIVPQGFYNATQIANNLVTQLNAAGTGSTWTFTAINAPPALIILNSTLAFTIVVPTTSSSQMGRFYETAGIIPQTAVLSGAVYTMATPSLPTLLPTRFIDITSHYLTKFQRVKDASTLTTGDSQNILARVYAFSSYGDMSWPPVSSATSQTSPYTTTWTWEVPSTFVVFQDYTSPKNIAWSPDEAISNFDITILDEYGNQLPWSPQYGVEFQMTLLASET